MTATVQANHREIKVVRALVDGMQDTIDGLFPISLDDLIDDTGVLGQVLTSNGPGTTPTMQTLSIPTVPVPDIQTFTSTGVGLWTKPAGAVLVLVRLWGAGGSGGCRTSTGNAIGGSGGAFLERWYSASALSDTESLSVGAGGASVPSSNASGNPGGSSTFSSGANLLTAFGGTGGFQAGAGSGAGGSGGAGALGAGAIAIGAAGAAGGAPVNITSGSQGDGNSQGGGWGSTGGTVGGNSADGGAGSGGVTAGGAGTASGNSLNGGGAGGCRGSASNGAAGTSVNGGNGGAVGVAGSQPGGGGGGNGGGSASGAGGNGMCVVYSWP